MKKHFILIIAFLLLFIWRIDLHAQGQLLIFEDCVTIGPSFAAKGDSIVIECDSGAVILNKATLGIYERSRKDWIKNSQVTKQMITRYDEMIASQQRDIANREQSYQDLLKSFNDVTSTTQNNLSGFKTDLTGINQQLENAKAEIGSAKSEINLAKNDINQQMRKTWGSKLAWGGGGLVLGFIGAFLAASAGK